MIHFIRSLNIGPYRLMARNRRRLKAETGHIHRKCDESDGEIDNYQIGVGKFSLSLTIFKGEWAKTR